MLIYSNLVPGWESILLFILVAFLFECSFPGLVVVVVVVTTVALLDCVNSDHLEGATARMPYTSPLHLSLSLPAKAPRVDSIDSEAVAMIPERPPLLRSYSAQSYIRRHRRSPSFSKLAPLPSGDAPDQSTLPRLSVVDPHASLRQSPPPRNNAIIPSGAVISPPESAGNSSDEETSPTTVRRRLTVERLDAAIRSLQSERATPQEEQDEAQAVNAGIENQRPERQTIRPLTPEARAISHSRSSTESDIQFLADSLDSSTLDDELGPKPPMVRKKSGEVVRPALRNKRRPSSMPGTPTFSKNVHFDSQLEHIKHFLQLDKPLAVSADTSPVETYSNEPEYPFRTQTVEWEIRLPNFPSDNTSRKHQIVHLERIYLSPDRQKLVGVVVVANLAFHKQVIARFTFDYWKTVSEVSAEFNHDVRRKHVNDGYDRFNFSINLSDITNLDTKTLFLCIRYTVAGQDHWDNNASMNYQVDFCKKENTQTAESHSIPTTNASHTLPLPRSRNAPSTASRPRSMPPSFDDFGLSPANFSSFSLESSKADSDFRLTPLEPHDLLEPPKRREKPARQAWGHRYDFGASLSAVRSSRSTEDRTTLAAKAKSSSTNGRAMPSNSGSQPLAIVSSKPHHESSSYKELVDKYCFYGSAKSMEPPLARDTLTFDGSASPQALDESLPRVDSGISMSSESASSSSSSSASSAMNSYNSSPIVYNSLYRSPFVSRNGFLESHPPAITG